MKNSVIFSDWIISVPVPMVNLEDFKVFDMDKLLVDHAPLHEVVAAKNFETFPIHIDMLLILLKRIKLTILKILRLLL